MRLRLRRELFAQGTAWRRTIITNGNPKKCEECGREYDSELWDTCPRCWERPRASVHKQPEEGSAESEEEDAHRRQEEFFEEEDNYPW